MRTLTATELVVLCANLPLFKVALTLRTPGTAMLAALALCDHSAAAAVPPRGQLHRVVVILSGVPSTGPGGMPRATGDASEALLLTQVLAWHPLLFWCNSQAGLGRAARNSSQIQSTYDSHRCSCGICRNYARGCSGSNVLHHRWYAASYQVFWRTAASFTRTVASESFGSRIDYKSVFKPITGAAARDWGNEAG